MEFYSQWDDIRTHNPLYYLNDPYVCGFNSHVKRANSMLRAQAAPRLPEWYHFGTKMCYFISKPIFKDFSLLKHFQTHKPWIKYFKIESLIHLQHKSPKIISFKHKIKHNMLNLNSTCKLLSQARRSFPFFHKLINSQPTTQFNIINIILYSIPSRNIFVQI